jgi:hypothetical protein
VLMGGAAASPEKVLYRKYMNIFADISPMQFEKSG